MTILLPDGPTVGYIIIFRAPVAQASWTSGYNAGGREFDSGRTKTQGLKPTEEKLLPL